MTSDDEELQVLARLRRSSSLASGARRGIAATGGARLAAQFAQFLGSLVLARLLSPTDYGTFTVLYSVVALASLLSDFGLVPSLVRVARLRDEHLATAFLLNLLSGFLLALAFTATAPLIADVFDEAAIKSYLPVISVIFIVNTNVVPLALLERAGRFSFLARTELFAAVLGLLATLAAAVAGAGVGSLVTGALTSAVVSTVAFWSRVRWRPSRRSSTSALRELVSIGAGLTGYSLTNYVGQNLDNVLLGARGDAAGLGQYNRAFNLARLPTVFVSGVLNRVLLPLYVEAQAKGGLVDTWRRFFVPTATVLFSTTVVMVSCSPLIITTLYGDVWSPSAPLLTVLALSIPFTTLGATLGPLLVLNARGRTWTTIGLAKAGLLAVGIGLGLGHGPLGVAVGVAAATVCGELLIILPAARGLGLSARTLWRDCQPATLTAAFVALPATSVRVAAVRGLPGLLLLMTSTVFAFGLSIRWVQPSTWAGMASLVRGQLSRRTPTQP